MTAFKLNPSSPLFFTWVQCLCLGVCYYKAQKYIQNKLTNTWGKQVDTVTLLELKHFPSTLPKKETSPSKQCFPVLSLPSPSPFLLLSMLTLGHLCVNSVCSFKITSSPIFLGIYNTIFCTVLFHLPALNSVCHSKGLKKDMLLKLEVQHGFCKGKLNPASDKDVKWCEEGEFLQQDK